MLMIDLRDATYFIAVAEVENLHLPHKSSAARSRR